MPTLAVAAHKGGVGKTAVAVNLAASLGRRGRRVLLVDCDPQGAAGAALGVQPGKPTLNEMLFTRGDNAIRSSSVAGLDVLPADLDLAAVELVLPERDPKGWRTALRLTLEPLTHRYDVLVLDTPPGLGVLPYMALRAATGALVTCPPAFLAFRSLPFVLETIDQAGASLLGIVPTMVERRSRHEREVLDALSEDYPGKVLTAIPRRVAVQDAQLAGVPLYDFAPTSDAVAAFEQLTTEVQGYGY